MCEMSVLIISKFLTCPEKLPRMVSIKSDLHFIFKASLALIQFVALKKHILGLLEILLLETWIKQKIGTKIVMKIIDLSL